ncbi:5-formyltetrahydrofolate cyclo-ligase [Acholeplasma equirhinis]|uniref:5-formyltetrahydrofolate cyclo-ligase n=1 Tax=Acholeplasma equirhinis TaxID=555393 RepID=UPI00197AD06A|nr:5-formyltetrahydrofolate cyclo-ligase [Acholeplasma equirhinis]MBN3490998.1 5-formyltetrahydrofolate cyclo-ligase [Acholeplasma equirhinis]
MDKKTLRKQILEKRSALTDARKKEAASKVIEKLCEDEHFLKADFVGLFYPANGEMDLMEIISRFPDKIFALPKTVNDKVMYLQYDQFTQLKHASFGIYEPQFGFDITAKLEVILVPCLGITKNFYRLGYGKGYFDKFFKNRLEVYKIGIIYEDEVVDFEPETYDIPMNDYISG